MGVTALQDYIQQRVMDVAEYIICTGATVRETAHVFAISKSTVHKDVTERLVKFRPGLAAEVQKVLQHNKEERHIRGGQATKIKHQKQHASGAGQ